jgi:hypothetical protein
MKYRWNIARHHWWTRAFSVTRRRVRTCVNLCIDVGGTRFCSEEAAGSKGFPTQLSGPMGVGDGSGRWAAWRVSRTLLTESTWVPTCVSIRWHPEVTEYLRRVKIFWDSASAMSASSSVSAALCHKWAKDLTRWRGLAWAAFRSVQTVLHSSILADAARSQAVQRRSLRPSCCIRLRPALCLRRSRDSRTQLTTQSFEPPSARDAGRTASPTEAPVQEQSASCDRQPLLRHRQLLLAGHVIRAESKIARSQQLRMICCCRFRDKMINCHPRYWGFAQERNDRTKLRTREWRIRWVNESIT